MQKSVEDIIRKVADKHGVSLECAKTVWNAQWKYTAYRMRCGKSGDYDSFKFIYLPGLMRFYTTRRKTKLIHEANEHKRMIIDAKIKIWLEKKKNKKVKK